MTQAEGLVRARLEPPPPRRVPSIAFTSGKGGVGKSSLVANTAALLAASGVRVLVVDADYGLANLAVIFGVCPSRTVEDALEGRCSLTDAVLHPLPRLGLLPAASGSRRLGQISTTATEMLLAGAESLAASFDLVLIDTAAGIAPSVLTTLAWAEDVVIVLSDDPASFIDAYAVVKLVLEEHPDKPLGTIVNRALGAAGVELQGRFGAVTRRFLGRAPEPLAVIPHDRKLSDAIRRQRLLTLDEPTAPASRALRALADTVVRARALGRS